MVSCSISWCVLHIGVGCHHCVRKLPGRDNLLARQHHCRRQMWATFVAHAHQYSWGKWLTVLHGWRECSVLLVHNPIAMPTNAPLYSIGLHWENWSKALVWVWNGAQASAACLSESKGEERLALPLSGWTSQRLSGPVLRYWDHAQFCVT